MRMNRLERFRIGGSADKPLLGIPLPKTPHGRVYRLSPNEDAVPRHFVLGDIVDGVFASEDMQKRMKLEPHSKQSVCPYSGVVDDTDAFMHPEDREAALDVVKHAAVQDMQDAIRQMFEDVARSSPMFSVEHSPSSPAPTPRFARPDLMRELVCDHCGRDYGVYAIGLFCPDCGAPNLRLHFRRETELVDAQVTLAEGLADEQHELAYRLLGNAHEDVLTAFEATLKAVYLHAVRQRPAWSTEVKWVGNDFQNIDRGRKRFKQFDLDPYAGLDDDALNALGLNIQIRHIIGHNLGIADERFQEHDADAEVGHTVALVGDEIRIFAGICQTVIDALDTWLGGGIAAPLASERPRVVPKTAQERGRDELRALKLTPLAERIGLWLSESSTDGLRGQIPEDELIAAFPDASQTELEEAVAELDVDHYIKTTLVLGPNKLPRMRIEYALYSAFDRAVHGHDPVQDSAMLARIVLENEHINVAGLHQASGWDHRRFNPALQIMASQIDGRRVIDRGGDGYAIDHFHLLADDKVSLRRWLKNLDHK